MNRISPVVKNLLIINVLLFIATYLVGNYTNSNFGVENPVIRYLALFFPKSEYFEPYQFITHMFMHGGLPHIFFNMYALWMFGTPIENSWGGKRFLFYYFFTGLGAAGLHTLVNFFVFSGLSDQIIAFSNSPTPELFKQFIESQRDNFNPKFISYLYDLYNEWTMLPSSQEYAGAALKVMNNVYAQTVNIPTVGASGAIFGVLLAFGMMYPNAQLMLLIPPMPIKAKWFVIGYGAIELFLGVSQPGSSIAHFAHIGGMLFGFILIKYWNSQAKKKNPHSW